MSFDREGWLASVTSSYPGYVALVAKALAARADLLGEVQAGMRDLRAVPGVKSVEADLAVRSLRATGHLIRVQQGRQGDPAVWQLSFPLRRTSGAGGRHGQR